MWQFQFCTSVLKRYMHFHKCDFFVHMGRQLNHWWFFFRELGLLDITEAIHSNDEWKWSSINAHSMQVKWWVVWWQICDCILDCHGTDKELEGRPNTVINIIVLYSKAFNCWFISMEIVAAGIILQWHSQVWFTANFGNGFSCCFIHISSSNMVWWNSKYFYSCSSSSESLWLTISWTIST